MHHAGDRLRTGVQLLEGRDPVPDFFDTFSEYVEFCVDYRAKLAQVVKLTAIWLPQQVTGFTCVYTTKAHVAYYSIHPVTGGQQNALRISNA